MTVHYDSQIFRLQKFGGISHYFAELINAIPGYGIQPLIQRPYSYNANYRRIRQGNLVEKLISGSYFKGRDRIKTYLLDRSDNKLKRQLASGNIELFHPTYYNDYYLDYLHPDTIMVITVHDMTHELYIAKEKGHDDFMEIRNKIKLLRRADKIIAISENTKKDILQLFPDLDEYKIEVIHHGIKLPEHKPDSLGEDSKYLLFVGNRSGYKNFQWLVKNIGEFLKKERKRLICYGSTAFSENEKTLLGCRGLEKTVVHKSFHSLEDLNNYYKNAFAFVFPSAHEGFGYPILEAFVNCSPVIIPKASCFPEIAGDGAVYYDLDSKEQLLSAIQSLKSAEVRRSIINKAWSKVQSFSIEASVSKHAALYQNLGPNSQ